MVKLSFVTAIITILQITNLFHAWLPYINQTCLCSLELYTMCNMRISSSCAEYYTFKKMKTKDTWCIVYEWHYCFRMFLIQIMLMISVISLSQIKIEESSSAIKFLTEGIFICHCTILKAKHFFLLLILASQTPEKQDSITIPVIIIMSASIITVLTITACTVVLVMSVLIRAKRKLGINSCLSCTINNATYIC